MEVDKEPGNQHQRELTRILQWELLETAVVATCALLRENPNPTEAQIRRGLSGNLCRCTGYQAMVDAVESLTGGER